MDSVILGTSIWGHMKIYDEQYEVILSKFQYRFSLNVWFEHLFVLYVMHERLTQGKGEVVPVLN
jgi:hypothetical protein